MALKDGRTEVTDLKTFFGVAQKVFTYFITVFSSNGNAYRVFVNS